MTHVSPPRPLPSRKDASIIAPPSLELIMAAGGSHDEHNELKSIDRYVGESGNKIEAPRQEPHMVYNSVSVPNEDKVVLSCEMKGINDSVNSG